MRSQSHWRTGLALTTVAALTLGACSSGGSSTTGPGASPGGPAAVSKADVAQYLTPPATLPVTKTVSKPIPSGLRIEWLAGPFPQNVTELNGFNAAAAILGWSVHAAVYDPNNPATITTSIESAIAAKPDAIVLGGVLTEQFTAQLPKAAAAHIPIISAATPNKPQPGVSVVVPTDSENSYTAKILADVIIADAAESGTTPHVLQLTVPAVSVYLGPSDEGMKSELAAKCPQCTRDQLDINLPDVFNGKYPQQVVSYLQRHPDINTIVSNSGQVGVGLGAALQQAGITNVKRYGLSATNVQLQEIKNGQTEAWVVQPYQVLGWSIADQVARVVTGDPTDLWENEHLCYVVDSSNVAGVNVDDPEFPADYQAQFRKLWNK